MTKNRPQVGIIMGSLSDWEPAMQYAAQTLDELKISHECRITSAHRTPDLVERYAREAFHRNIKIIIAGAGGAAHLPGMTAAQSGSVPIIGVPMETKLGGMDSLLSINQMPAGTPVGTMTIGKAGAINAAVYAAQMLAITNVGIRKRLLAYQEETRAKALAMGKELDRKRKEK